MRTACARPPRRRSPRALAGSWQLAPRSGEATGPPRHEHEGWEEATSPARRLHLRARDDGALHGTPEHSRTPRLGA